MYISVSCKDSFESYVSVMSALKRIDTIILRFIVEIDIWADPANAKEMLQRTNGARTIPQIFVGDHYVGGNEQLQNANRSGELDKILKDNET